MSNETWNSPLEDSMVGPNHQEDQMSLYVTASVVIREGCPLAITVGGAHHAQIVCGWMPYPVLDVVVEREPLRALVELTTDALATMTGTLP
jgi:hypothetical protein